jgi:hypothetical protein
VRRGVDCELMRMRVEYRIESNVFVRVDECSFSN